MQLNIHTYIYTRILQQHTHTLQHNTHTHCNTTHTLQQAEGVQCNRHMSKVAGKCTPHLLQHTATHTATHTGTLLVHCNTYCNITRWSKVAGKCTPGSPQHTATQTTTAQFGRTKFQEMQTATHCKIHFNSMHTPARGMQGKRNVKNE